MKSKFKRVEALRGEMNWGEYGHDALTGAAGGAAAGALAGGVGAVPGALGGAVVGVAGKGITDIWYNTRSNQDKASWQAGDLEDSMAKVSKLLNDSGQPELKTLAQYLAAYSKQYKTTVDSYQKATNNNQPFQPAPQAPQDQQQNQQQAPQSQQAPQQPFQPQQFGQTQGLQPYAVPTSLSGKFKRVFASDSFGADAIASTLDGAVQKWYFTKLLGQGYPPQVAQEESTRIIGSMSPMFKQHFACIK